MMVGVWVAAGSASTQEPSARLERVQQPSIACYRAALERTFLEEYRARNLCRGSEIAAPVDCYIEARDRTPLSDLQSIDLCRCARSTEPVACYERADDETDLMEAEVIRMCSAQQSQGLYLPDCQQL